MDTYKTKLKEMLDRLITGKEYAAVLLADRETGQYLRVRDGELYQEDWSEEGLPGELLAFIKRAPLAEILGAIEKEGRCRRIFTSSAEHMEGKVWQVTWQYLEAGKPWLCILAREITEMFARDTLTGLLNHKAFIHETGLVFSQQPSRKFAVLFFDVVNFKSFNGLFGFEMGDTLLKNIARKIQESFLKPVLCARIESDHFMALAQRDKVNRHRLGELLRYVFNIEDTHYCFYSHCGIYLPDGSLDDVSDMCDCARIACNSVRSESARPYAFYNSFMSQQQLSQGLVQFNFESSVQNGEFQIYYQPIFDVATEKMVSAEALVRWELPGHGLISPQNFIPTLESSGHISKLDIYISQQVFQFQKERRDKGRRTVPVSVNISRVDVHDMECIRQIRNYLRRDPEVMRLLRLEITESSYGDISEQGRRFLSLLRMEGVKILIDDFGNGKSSFSTLEDFEFDYIKIDMGFIRKIGLNSRNDTICRAIINMAHSIGVKLVAEGVETREQVNFLRENKCDFIQGYYYSKPVHQKEFARLLDVPV